MINPPLVITQGNLWSGVRFLTFHPPFCIRLSRQTWSECARLWTKWLASPPRPTGKCPRGPSISWTCPGRWWPSRCGERKWVLDMVAMAKPWERRCPSQTGIAFSSTVPINSLRLRSLDWILSRSAGPRQLSQCASSNESDPFQAVLSPSLTVVALQQWTDFQRTHLCFDQAAANVGPTLQPDEECSSLIGDLLINY